MDQARVDEKVKKDEGVWETIKVIFQALLIAVVVRTVLFQPFNIPSGSLVPTLLVGDYLFVSKYAYGYSRYSIPFGRRCSRAASGAPSRSAATSPCSSCRRTTRPITSSASSACPATASRWSRACCASTASR